MIEMPLSKGRVALIDDADAELVRRYNWRTYARPRSGGCNYYAYTHPAGKILYMHRLIMAAGAGIEVDHIDCDGLNNQRSNLRFATRAQNCANKNTGLQHRGICWDKQTSNWRCTISFNNKNIHVGRFGDRDDALRAYDRRALELYGEFARLNFPVTANG